MSQVVKRIYALADNGMPFTKTKQREGIKLSGLESNIFEEGQCYSRLATPDFIIDLKKPGNNIILSRVGRRVYKVTKILQRHEKVHLLCNEYINPTDVYTTPIRSSELNVFNVCELKSETTWIQMNDIKLKFCVVPSQIQNTFFLFPLLHTF